MRPIGEIVAILLDFLVAPTNSRAMRWFPENGGTEWAGWSQEYGYTVRLCFDEKRIQIVCVKISHIEMPCGRLVFTAKDSDMLPNSIMRLWETIHAVESSRNHEMIAELQGRFIKLAEETERNKH